MIPGTAASRTCALLLCLAACECTSDSDGAAVSVPNARRPPERTPPPQGPPPAMHPPPGPPEVALEPIVEDLTAPTDLVTAPDGTMVVLEQSGPMLRIEAGELVPFGDLSDRVVELKQDYDERGLLGMAFHPDYPEDPRVFAYYSAPLRPGAPKAYDHTNVLSEFRVVDGRVDPGSERELLSLPWPAPNHDGGTVAFGPDRMLYLSMGDGGRAVDKGLGHPPMGNGQDYTTLMGSILRIDPEPPADGSRPYGIPPGNPFAGPHPGADEIWAYGLRNVYSFAFDSESGMLVAGDVGQDLYEEVNVIERGENYGWSIREGPVCLNPFRPTEPKPECPEVGPHGEPLVPPVLSYAQPETVAAEDAPAIGISVIGGEIYRGSAVGPLAGAFVFGDWSRTMDAPEGMLLVGRPSPSGEWALERLPVQGVSTPHVGHYVRGFGRDRAGEVYVLTSDRKGPTGDTGVVWRIEPAK